MPTQSSDSGRQAKKALILKAAQEEFAQKGLEAASMRGIALRAACTTGAIYPLFATKEHIYAALLRDSLTRVSIAMGRAIAPAQNPEAALGRAAAMFIRHYLKNPFEVNLGLYAFNGLKRQGVGRVLNTELNGALQGTLRIFETLFQQTGRFDGRQAKNLTNLLFSQMTGALVLAISGRLKVREAAPEALTRDILALILK